MRILFEARSIIPNKSGGIENYLYMLVNAWKSEYEDDEIIINIPPSTEALYKERIVGATFLTDHVYKVTLKLINKYFFIRYFLRILIKFFPDTEKFFFGLRKGWIRKLDESVDIIIYPFQREQFVHDSKKTILVMHDFREWDTDGGSKRIIKRQVKAINNSAAIIVSWPYPHKRLIELFPRAKSKVFEIPFLFDVFSEDDLNISNDNSDFLYYPSANAPHKNHENLIIGLSHYNRNNPDNKLKLICTGPIDPKRQKVLDNLLDKYKAKEFVCFLGFIPRDQVFRTYQDCYAVITSSKYEAFSGAVLEAFRFKKPVIASSIPPITIFLKQYELELTLFNPYKPESISMAIETLTKNYSRHLEMSIIGYNRLKNISPKNTVIKFKEIALTIARKNGETFQP